MPDKCYHLNYQERETTLKLYPNWCGNALWKICTVKLILYILQLELFPLEYYFKQIDKSLLQLPAFDKHFKLFRSVAFNFAFYVSRIEMITSRINLQKLFIFTPFIATYGEMVIL